MALWLWLLLIAAAVMLAVYLYNSTRIYLVGRHIPGPWSFPLVGSFPTLFSPPHDAAAKWKALMREYGTTLRFYMGPLLAVVVAEPEDLEVVLNSPHFGSKPSLVYRGIIPMLGLGLVTLNGEEHRRHRKAISPSLHLDILQAFVPAFQLRAAELCDSFDAFAASGEVFNANPYLARYNGDAVCDTVFSTDCAGIEAEKAAFLRSLDKASRFMMYRAIRPWLAFEWTFRLSSMHAPFWKAARIIDSFSAKVVSMKMKHGLQSEHKADRRRRAFLDHMLSSEEGKALTELEMREELKTLALGASATTMDFLSFFLVSIAIEQDVQRKIHEELDEVFGGDAEREVEATDLPHLVYLECVLKEVLRKFPPVFTFSRMAEKEVTLPSGYVVPRGAIIGLMPLLAHYNEKSFPDPDRFDPDRFLPEQSRRRHPYAFIPFSAGPRNCIGQRYGMMSAKVVTSNILRRFRVLRHPETPATINDIRVKVGISTSLRGGARIRVERRT